jgi:hemerythrin
MTLDELERASAANLHRDELESLMSFFMVYLSEHFRSEEVEMRLYGYPLFEEHKASHAGLWEPLDEQIEQLETASYTHTAVKDITRWITGWLAFHILNEDADLAVYLAMRDAGDYMLA